MKKFKNEITKAYDPENPESYVNGSDDRESDFDGICDTFGVNYRDGDADTVTAWLKGQEAAMA